MTTDSPQLPDSASISASRPCLLLVDDQVIDVQRLSRIFAAEYEVLSATRGEDALALCRQRIPDLILLDVMMPGMNGHEVCMQLKADEVTRNIPVIFVTGHTDPVEESNGLKLGAVDFIAKPVNPAVVRARVKTHITLKSHADRLRESEARLRDFADMSADWYWESDKDMRLTYMSESIKEHFSININDDIGDRRWQIAGALGDTQQNATLRQMYGERRPVHNLEVVRKSGSGERQWSSLNARPQFSANGTFCGYRGTGTDITARKRAEMRQQHINGVLRLMMVNTPLPEVLATVLNGGDVVNDGEFSGAILLCDETSTSLKLVANCNLPDFVVSALEALPLSASSPTSMWSATLSGQPVIVPDVRADSRWQGQLGRVHEAHDAKEANDPGLRAFWSQPILSAQGKVLGLLTQCRGVPGEPSAENSQWMEDNARLAALAIEKSLAEGQLRLAASVFSHAREGIMITDLDGNFVDVNDAFTHITGYTREEVLGRNPRLLQSGLHGPEFYTSVWRDLLSKGYWQGEIWNRRQNGEIYAELKTIGAVSDSNGNKLHYIGLFSDITLMKEYAQQLERIAHYDALTGLPNRVMLADRLHQAMIQSLRRNRFVAVTYLDLDGFKAVNDVHGHGIGDKLLIAISKRMKLALREGDTLARIGGDEFVAVLVDLHKPNDFEPVVARLLQAAAEPVVEDGALLHVSASIGLTVYPKDNVDADQLMRHADQAMYLAKQAGKNRYHLFDVAQDAAVKTQRDTVERIRSALEQREFVLHYQPKVNMRTGKVTGAEALIRWMHPQRGLIAPSGFLPVIEDSPIAIDLGEWVIDTALAQLSTWRSAGLDIPVSVNIGALQMQHVGFFTSLERLLAGHAEVPANRLELEILETSALEDINHISEVIQSCRAIGISFALDDFGTGYSSLTYLKRLSAQVLKIDQSFIRDMLEDPDDLAIVKGIIGLAQAFRRDVIAEGVETVAHGNLLLSLGCDVAQGYAIAKPMPAHEMPGWIAQWTQTSAWSHPPTASLK